MTHMKRLTAILILAAGFAHAADNPKEEDYYPITILPIPEDVVLEASGMEMMPDGKLAVCGRRGNLYTVENPLGNPGSMKFKLYADGLHEPLGLSLKDGWLYATQRGEVTRMKDTNGDGRADVFETVNDGWGITGDYHEYAFGSRHDKDGNIWVVLCLTGSFNSNIDYRGWCVRVTPEGKLIPTASGIRSPGGIGLNHLGDVFYSDNQGPWNGSSSLKHLRPGSFQGHPDGFKWFDLAAVKAALGGAPVKPNTNSRMVTERQRVKELVPPACVLPHGKLGNSTSGFAFDGTGKFGVFKNQLLAGDQTASTINRIFLEKVNGVYQGAAILFRKGFGSGNLSVMMTPEGALFVGGTDRGWGAKGGKKFALERVDWTGKVPFEIHEMRAKPDGFELTFTHEVDAKTVGDIASYTMEAYTYIYRSDYGSPEVDKATPKVTAATVAADKKSVRLKVSGLTKGHVHELHSKGVRSAAGLPLLHAEAYYTLNEIPAE
ncbi:MAG: hypothetical protein EXS22_02505 [Pedosphaera sp.]|nr:hypothetical protein [Pedosphaera sp.]MSU42896.1 hypothetical protein [Pedosphaera sp.]